MKEGVNSVAIGEEGCTELPFTFPASNVGLIATARACAALRKVIVIEFVEGDEAEEGEEAHFRLYAVDVARS